MTPIEKTTHTNLERAEDLFQLLIAKPTPYHNHRLVLITLIMIKSVLLVIQLLVLVQ